MELTQQDTLQNEIVVPVVPKKPRIPPFFVSLKGDWRQLVALAKLIAPSFQPQMLGRFLKVTVVVRGLPSNTEPEDIKTEIEAEGFKVIKISQMKNYRTKAPMPLFYVQIENGVDAPKIYDFTELFGTRIEARKVSPGLDYSKVVQNKIPREHVSPPSTSKPTIRPAPSKDASINAGLLKDLLEVIEESPSIDKQTFCRAFKNSLSALRLASADVDETYVIFEAYYRLRSLQA
ncbi:zinc finger protein [Trichonephila clavipes]|nr:zinc finger protein [Trichonephila clavipes]